MADEKTFFENEGVLNYASYTSTMTACDDERTLQEIVADYASDATYTVIVHAVNTLAVGRYQGDWMFARPVELVDAYIRQVRLFNENKEILITRKKTGYYVRCIDDTEGKTIQAVDVAAPLLGNRVEADVPQGFVRLFEPGRKIERIIPVESVVRNYRLRTRSYITYDEDTGQAGYGYSRYVAIEAK